MGDVIQFPNPPWIRLTPWWPEAWEINCQVVYDFLGWEVPRPENLSVFEHRWLDNLRGYRHREVFNYLNGDADRRGLERWHKLEELHGYAGSFVEVENIRWSKQSGYRH